MTNAQAFEHFAFTGKEPSYNNSMTTTDTTVSYPYAYGLLDGGLKHFAETFETNARVKGFDVDPELMQYMKEELKKLSDKAHDKGVAHNKEYGF